MEDSRCQLRLLYYALGDKIHASVRKTLIYKFERNLKEGFVYSISNFGVACNGGSFRTSRHEYKINFQIGTKVLNVDRGLVSCSPFSFVLFCDINEGYDTNYLIDVIGFFTGVGTERQYERNGLPMKMNVIELESEGAKIECALFGPYVDELNSFLATGEVHCPIVILQLAKVKPFQGKIQLQNAMSCTNLLFNPSCVEVNALRQRYRIKVRVVDDTDSATFVIFDKDAQILLNKTCSLMVDTFDKNAVGSDLPAEILGLVNKTYLFKVDLRNFGSRFDRSFRVKRICSDEIMIEKFKALKSFSKTTEDVVDGVESGEAIMQDLMIKFSDAVSDSQALDSVVADSLPPPNAIDDSQPVPDDIVSLDCTQNDAIVEVGVTPTKRHIGVEGHDGEGSNSGIKKKAIKVEKD